MTHICVGNLTIIGPDNGLSPGRRQAIIWTNAGILSIGPWGTNFSEILIGIHTLSLKKTHLKMSSAKWRPFCLCLNVLICHVSLPHNLKTGWCEHLIQQKYLALMKWLENKHLWCIIWPIQSSNFKIPCYHHVSYVFFSNFPQVRFALTELAHENFCTHL